MRVPSSLLTVRLQAQEALLSVPVLKVSLVLIASALLPILLQKFGSQLTSGNVYIWTLVMCTAGDMSIFDTESNRTSASKGPKSVESNYAAVDATSLQMATDSYHDEFPRYKLLRDFTEGDLSWQAMHPIIALILGFRVVRAGNQEIHEAKIIQDQQLNPIGWGGQLQIPDFSDTDDVGLLNKLTGDLPEDEESTDIIIEAMVGGEMYKLLQISGDAETKRRFLVGKWLYVQGFLGDDFPVTSRFIPGHLRDDGGPARIKED